MHPEGDPLSKLQRELSILHAFAADLNRSVSVEEALQRALRRVTELFELSTGWVWLINESTGEPYLAAAQNLPPGLTEDPSRMEGSCYCLDTYRSGDLRGAANIGIITCSRLKRLLEGTGGLRYHASIPLYAHGEEKVGVLNVASSDWRQLSPDDLRLLHTVGDLLAIAVQRARLFAQSKRLGELEERNRLARELHDTLGQHLAAITLHLESAEALLEAGAEGNRVRESLRKAVTLTRGALEETRRFVLDLRAAPLEGRTLPEALAELVQQALPPEGTSREAARGGGAPSERARGSLQRDEGRPKGAEVQPKDSEGRAQIQLAVTGANHPLPARVESALYRIAQEALSNALRHGQASRISIRLTTTPEAVTLAVEDDGQGFDPASTPASRGRFGLIGIRERARLLGGTAHIATATGKGTRVEVTVPLLRQEHQ